MKNKMIIFSVLICLSLLVSQTANSIDPWANDPLKNINFDQIKKEAPPKEVCQTLDYCPICDVVEEWPLDFNGDDLAEIAQRRICTQNTEYKVRPEAIIIYSSARQPIIYKTNLNSCKQEIMYTEFKRFDFNKDNLDELLIVEKDLEKHDETISVLGFDFGQQKIVEIPIIDYLPDLESKLIKNEVLDLTKETFGKLNGKQGFVLKARTNLKRVFDVFYFQDSSDRKFYPLKVRLSAVPKTQYKTAIKRP